MGMFDRVNLLATPVAMTSTGWSSSCTVLWCQPVAISESVRMSPYTMGRRIPRCPDGPMQGNSWMVGVDLSIMSKECLFGMIACIGMEFPMHLSVCLLCLGETDLRVSMVPCDFRHRGTHAW